MVGNKINCGDYILTINNGVVSVCCIVTLENNYYVADTISFYESGFFVESNEKMEESQIKGACIVPRSLYFQLHSLVNECRLEVRGLVKKYQKVGNAELMPEKVYAHIDGILFKLLERISENEWTASLSFFDENHITIASEEEPLFYLEKEEYTHVENDALEKTNNVVRQYLLKAQNLVDSFTHSNNNFKTL